MQPFLLLDRLVMAKPKTTLSAQDRKVVEAQLQTVRKIAFGLARRLPASVEHADLVQDGVLGLMEALLRWTRETTGAHFESYVAQRAQGAMIDGLRELDHGSRSVRRSMRRVEEAIQVLSHQLGHAPREKDIASALGLRLPDYQRLLQDAQGYLLISLQDLAGEESQEYLDHCVSESANPLVVLERAALRLALVRAIKTLPRQKQTVLRLYYEEDLKMREIGEQMRLTEARISQIHAQAIAQLRATMPEGDISKLLKPRRRPRTPEAETPDATAAPG